MFLNRASDIIEHKNSVLSLWNILFLRWLHNLQQRTYKSQNFKWEVQVVVISAKNTKRFRSNELYQTSFFFDDIDDLHSLQSGRCSKNGKPTCSKNATKFSAQKIGKIVHSPTKICKQIIFLNEKIKPTLFLHLWSEVNQFRS